MNHKTLCAKKQNFIALINKKIAKNLETNDIVNELVSDHRIDFMREYKINVNRY